MEGSTAAHMRRQYEAFPYPHRDPRDEARRIIHTELDELDHLNHYCFGGGRDFRCGFRALVAGGGTGDTTVYLARQLRDTAAEIVHLDLSRTSIEVARRRAEVAGVAERIRFVEGSLLELDRLDLGKFDYVNACGVLHHLESPANGLHALASVLADDGAMGLMLYGRYGRTGIYLVQQLMQLVNGDDDDDARRIERTRAVLEALPEQSWYKQSREVFKHEDTSDAGVYDKFLHSCDRPFTVPEIYELLDAADLHLVEFTRSMRMLYDIPPGTLPDEAYAPFAALTRRKRQAAAELFWGLIAKHSFWAARRADTAAVAGDPENVPFWTRTARSGNLQQALVSGAGPTWTLNLSSDVVRIPIAIRLDAATRTLFAAIDGQTTLGTIWQRCLASDARLTPTEVREACQSALESLRSYDLVLLRRG